ncbi:acetoin utilization protein [Pseudoxanthomonas kalamensis DSM 18571]|uniref:histone deacetylase family protein n=1 Tax=Pseudoxanthomonas kalamensis TaxID=289483 RepID=UPI001390FCA1|nr:histone deacetylase family protein [Pseudoxanthomonas kalamensis]KAF1711143.1 acetoin utilization protein [Pseudoxanthomonas kalamensis DSM 18571]
MIIFTHPACLEHDTGPEHPECADRLRVVLESLREAHGDLDWRQAPLAKLGELHRVHDHALVEAVMDGDFDGHRMLDPDTVVSPKSRLAALRAAGAGVAAVDAVMNGPDTIAFCAVRPPGHHATPQAAMGFCLFNNIAIAAAYACEQYGLSRVAVIDFDVHHGNGTQAIFWDEPRVAYFSSHQSDLYPHTGAPREHGSGNIHNVLLPPGSGGFRFRNVWEDQLLPDVASFRPQLVLVSAGFDAHMHDPLADLMLEAEDFAWLSGRLKQIAAQHAGGRLVSMLEGGYSLDALRECSVAHVAALR